MAPRPLRFAIVREVFIKELRETLRDRRSLSVMFGVPLLLYPLLTLATASVGSQTAQRMANEVARVAVVNPGEAPGLIERLKDAKSGIELVSTEDPESALRQDRLDAVIVAPPGYERDVLAGKATELKVKIDRSRSHANYTEDKIDRAVDAYEERIVQRRLEKYGAPPGVLQPLKSATEDVAVGDGRFGRMLGMLLPMMLLLTGMLGAFFPAVTATTAERELNTLEALLVTPAGRMEILLGKTALVMLSALLTAGLNMISMSLVLWRTASMAAGMASGAGGGGGTLAGMTLDPLALLLAYIAAVPTILFFSAAVMVVGLFARNYREANSYVTPVMLLSMAPLFVSLTDPEPSLGLLVTPAINSTLVIRAVLTGHFEPTHYAISFIASCLYAGLMLSLAARLFSSEQLVNPQWEPVSTKGLLTRRPHRGERRLPAVDEALALYAGSLLLLFYVSPSWIRSGLIPMLAGVELLLIAAPALVFAWLGRYRWVETFSLRAPRGGWLVGAALLGLGSLPWMYLLLGFQHRIWPPDPATSQAMERIFAPALEQNPWFTAIAVGLLAGVCEEILYRGPIQTALARKLRPIPTLWIGGLLFAAAHVDAGGMVYRTLLGVLLGWMVLRGGSIFPAMLAHALIDTASLTLGYLARDGSALKGSVWDPEVLLKAASVDAVWVQLAVGAVMLAVGYVLCRASAGASDSRT